MQFNEYQQWAVEAKFYPKSNSDFTYHALAMAGETGEVCEKVKKIIRDHGGIMTPAHAHDLAKEIGDCLYYMANLATAIGVDLEEVARLNQEKLEGRKARGTLSGSGDNR